MSAVLPESSLPGDFGAAVEAGTRVNSAPVSLPVSMSQTPVERLEQSRDRMRAAMMPAPVSVSAKPTTLIGSWLDSLMHLPGVDVVVDTLKVWWSRHPLYQLSEVAGSASRAAVKPYAEQHPLSLVLLAALGGVAISWLRPWRWAIRSALFAGLIPQILARTLKKLPIESWLTMLSSALARAPRKSYPVASGTDAVAAPSAQPRSRSPI